jgi:hypothetical protein
MALSESFDTMVLSGSFDFVSIPADRSLPVKSHTGDKAGGLSDDALVKFAKNYFFEKTGSKNRASVLENATPEERKVLAQQVRDQLAASDIGAKVKDMDDDTVLDVIYRSQSQPACDIVALTVPTEVNGYGAVSMYSADNAKDHGFPLNDRATAILTACGHASLNGGVFGDVFIGRAKDNERTDIWERIDFSVADANPKADWCRVARSRGGGGGSGAAAASSLSNLVQQTPGAKLMDTSGGAQANSLFGSNGAPPVVEAWGSWTQTKEEVELKFAVAPGTKAKYCKINFGRTTLKVTVAGKVLLQGAAFNPIALDESTFTLQDEGPTGRELCVTLGKTDPQTWSWVAQ